PPPPLSPLFPYTTLFRSLCRDGGAQLRARSRPQACAGNDEACGPQPRACLLSERRALLSRHDRRRAASALGTTEATDGVPAAFRDRKSTRLNSSHLVISY